MTVEHALELVRRHLGEPATVALTDIVHQHIDVTEFGNGLPRGIELRDIEGRAANIQALGTQRKNSGFNCAGLPPIQHHTGPGAG